MAHLFQKEVKWNRPPAVIGHSEEPLLGSETWVTDERLRCSLDGDETEWWQLQGMMMISFCHYLSPSPLSQVQRKEKLPHCSCSLPTPTGTQRTWIHYRSFHRFKTHPLPSSTIESSSIPLSPTDLVSSSNHGFCHSCQDVISEGFGSEYRVRWFPLGVEVNSSESFVWVREYGTATPGEHQTCFEA